MTETIEKKGERKPMIHAAVLSVPGGLSKKNYSQTSCKIIRFKVYNKILNKQKSIFWGGEINKTQNTRDREKM